MCFWDKIPLSYVTTIKCGAIPGAVFCRILQKTVNNTAIVGRQGWMEICARYRASSPVSKVNLLIVVRSYNPTRIV